MQMFDKKQIVENGENGEIEDVLIAPVGEFIGSSKSGEPIEQNFTQESLERLAEGLNQSGREILCDADHASAREGLDRDTRAVGWFSKFVANAKGLFGLLKLTKWGRELIENREYRSVSPVFHLNEDNEPVALMSVASTNTPAISVPENTILNQSTQEDSDKSEDLIHMDITREELVELIKTTFNECKNECGKQDTEVVVNQESTQEKPTEEQKTVEDEQKPVEEGQKTVTEEKQDKPVTEVITEEALNSTPTTVPDVNPAREWMNLSGRELSNWIQTHREEVMEYQRQYYQTH